MAQIKKINIKGVEYNLAGSGNSTTDTAYVDNKTLYIEEGTTAGGGSNVLEIDLTPYFESIDEDLLLALITGIWMSSVNEDVVYNFFNTRFTNETIYNTLIANNYNDVRFLLNVEGLNLISPKYSITVNDITVNGSMGNSIAKIYSKPAAIWMGALKVEISIIVATTNVNEIAIACITQKISNETL